MQSMVSGGASLRANLILTQLISTKVIKIGAETTYTSRNSLRRHTNGNCYKPGTVMKGWTVSKEDGIVKLR